MIKINDNYLKLQSSYLFSEIAKRVSSFQKDHPDREVIKMGIGDVTRPLPQACIEAFHLAVDEMATEKNFHGYGPEQGYPFLREKIAQEEFQSRGAEISADEVFISDGAKCDTANIQEIFATNARIAVPDPVYPVYVDTNVMAGRTGEWNQGRYPGLVYLESTRENSFLPDPPDEEVDLVYLCFPNNPTGAAASKDYLASWVDYAHKYKALILYDAAYVSFMRDDRLPQSIFEIDGGREVAIEFRSFSKTAGFTGTRCAFTVVPKECRAWSGRGDVVPLRELWSRRQTTKFNGVSYPVQKAAEAVYSDSGKKQLRELSDFYLDNAKLIKDRFENLGFATSGGVHSPYIWIYVGRDSWEFFDHLLEKAGVVITPGSGFGKCGDGYIRASSFGSRENAEKGMKMIAEAGAP